MKFIVICIYLPEWQINTYDYNRGERRRREVAILVRFRLTLIRKVENHLYLVRTFSLDVKRDSSPCSYNSSFFWRRNVQRKAG